MMDFGKSAKPCFSRGIRSSLSRCMAFESTAQAILFEDAEKHERMTRFLERKKPKS